MRERVSKLIAAIRYNLWGDEASTADNVSQGLVTKIGKVADDIADRVSILKKLTERLDKGAG